MTNTEQKARVVRPVEAFTDVILPTMKLFGAMSFFRAVIEITSHNIDVILGKNPTAGPYILRDTRVTGMSKFKAPRL